MWLRCSKTAPGVKAQGQIRSVPRQSQVLELGGLFYVEEEDIEKRGRNIKKKNLNPKKIYTIFNKKKKKNHHLTHAKFKRKYTSLANYH